MIDTVDDATARRAMLYGLRQIVRYNWPQYATSVAVIAGAVAALYLNDWPRPMRWILAALIGLAGWWTLASLAVSHWVYDRADVADGRRIIHLVPAAPRRWALIHVGVDDTSPAIRTARRRAADACWTCTTPIE